MKKRILVFTTALLALSLTLGGVAQATPSDCPRHAVVSASWLAARLGAPGLVVVDVRTAEEYAAGHIPGSVSMPLVLPTSAWTVARDDLMMELPETSDLFAALGKAGISRTSRVVIVTSMAQPPYPQANATRAAITLLYAGVKNVSVLDGGYPKWIAEGRQTSTQVPTVNPVNFEGSVNTAMFVSTEYVAGRIGTTLIVDARDAEVYSGQVVEPWAQKPGHIPSAVSLPTPRIWNADGTYKSRQDLRTMVSAVAGNIDKGSEIIIYCGVGGYGSSWVFVLREILGYRNVKLYDGAAQAWVRTHEMETGSSRA